MRRLVAFDVEMFDRQRPVMRGHLLVMPLRDRIGRAFRAALNISAFSCRILAWDIACSVCQVRQAR